MEVLTEPVQRHAKESPKAFFARHYRSAMHDTARFVCQKGGSYEDAKDILHDALIILYESANHDDLIDDRYRYLMGIVRNLWYKRMKHDRSSVAISENEIQIDLPSPTLHEQRLLSVLELAGKKCMDLLTAFYFSGEGIDMIKKVFGFTSAHSASVQKYKCIEKLKATVKEKSLHYEDFTN